MRLQVDMIAAPTSLSPGGYVPVAYRERNMPKTPVAEVEAEKVGKVWRVSLAWACSEPVRDIAGDVDRFVDAAALLAPSVADAPWMTMGAPGKAVEGVLWRADRKDLTGVRAEGLGTVERDSVPGPWRAQAAWKDGKWRVDFEIEGWAVLDTERRLAIAVWQGAHGDRAGLKSVSPRWLAVD